MSDEYQEEQEMEMEALQSMFLDGEYKQIDDRKFSLTLVPVQGADASDNHVSVDLICEYTPKYPDEKAMVDVKVVKGLKESQRKEILALLDTCQEENIGMPCVYSMADVIVEYLQENNRPAGDGSIHAEMLERQRLKEEAQAKENRVLEMEKKKAEKLRLESEEGQRQRYGTPLTRENFEEFNKKFIAAWDVKMEKLEIERLEALASKTKSSKGKLNDSVKLTGKQLFEVDTKMITSDANLLAELAFEKEQNARDEVFGSNVLQKQLESQEASDLSNVDFSLFQSETALE
eukprot:g7807.t1